MDNTVTIRITNKKAMNLLAELEDLKLIEMVKEKSIKKMKLSEKYKGVFSKKDAQSFNAHTRKMRNEWNNF